MHYTFHFCSHGREELQLLGGKMLSRTYKEVAGKDGGKKVAMQLAIMQQDAAANCSLHAVRLAASMDYNLSRLPGHMACPPFQMKR